MLCWTDNTATEKGVNKVSSKSLHGQQLIGVMADLIRIHSFGIRSLHIPGVDNDLADFIPLPIILNLSHTTHLEQIYQKHDLAWTWDYLHPSPELLQSLSFALFSSPMLGLLSLPRNLG